MNVSVDGAELFYTVRGTGPACLVPSSIGTKPYERMMPSQLSDRLQLVFVDLRGSGRSTGEPRDLTFDLLAGDLEAVRLDLGAEKVAVLGHSILGIPAIEYGRRRPEAVSHVIAVGTPPRGNMVELAASAARFFEEDASDERKQILRDNLSRLPLEPSFTQTFYAQTPTRFFDARFDPAPLFAEADFKPGLLRHLMGTLTPAWDVAAGAGGLVVPIFLASGRFDYVVPHLLWKEVWPAIPGATFEIFERSGHQPFFEEPDRFAEVVTSWIDGQR